MYIYVCIYYIYNIYIYIYIYLTPRGPYVYISESLETQALSSGRGPTALAIELQ